MMPQASIMKDRVRPMGNRCMRYVAGNSVTM